MHLIGRWEKVRQFGVSGWGQPWMLDRKWSALRPYRCDDWWRDPQSQAWLPVVRGGALIAGHQYGLLGFGLRIWPSGAGITATAVALDSSYSRGTGGDAIGNRCSVTQNETLTTVYFRVSGYTGTAANVTEVNFELRNETSGLPGTTLHTSASHTLAAATGWLSITGLSFAMTTAASPYWAIMGDANGGTTDYVSLHRDLAIVENALAVLSQSSSTADGWGTQSLQARVSGVVLILASGRTLGSPYSASGVSTNTNKKGWRIGGFTTGVKVLGFIVTPDADYNRAEWWAGTSGPSGTPTQSTTLRGWGDSSSALNVQAMLFSSGLSLAAGETGRLVADSSVGGSTQYRRINIGTGEDATLRSAMLGGGAFHYVEANGTTDWSLELIGSFPQGDLLLEDMIAGGNGTTVVYHGGMTGGLY